MNELKTISQIAAELGVTRQAVYQRIKSTELSTRLQPFTVKQNNTKVYTLQGQELIKQAFSSGVNVNCKQAVDSKRQSIDSKLIDSLQATIATLTNQLESKDKQIEKLTEQVSTLLQQIDKLTTALQAAQALHGMDKQQAVIEVQERPAEQAQITELKEQLREEKEKSEKVQNELTAKVDELQRQIAAATKQPAPRPRSERQQRNTFFSKLKKRFF